LIAKLTEELFGGILGRAASLPSVIAVQAPRGKIRHLVRTSPAA
jgi:hypothetical protein